jgi:tryptophan 7-halogenase
VIDRYNAQCTFEYLRIRDFLILHFNATERDDTPFWNLCRTMQIPQQLSDNIRLFKDSGRFYRDAEEMFATTSWVQVMIGQGIMPDGYHPMVDQMPDHELKGFMTSVRNVVSSCVDAMPMHQAFIDSCCKA